MRHTVREELKGIVTFVVVIWAVFIVDAMLPADLRDFGLIPRTGLGLIGVPAMPFLHANFQHICSNTVPLVILLALLAGSHATSWQIVTRIVVLGGLLLWVFGRPATHIGASGLVFGLAAFLIVAGFVEKRPLSLLISLLVMFLYGGSLLAGMLPSIGPEVSWDGHLTGFIAGGWVAYRFARQAIR